MGQIITIFDDYKYEIPDPPRDEKEIFGYDLKKSEQIWRIPPRLAMNSREISDVRKMEYVQIERERWLNGFWMFIAGEPTWITGMHWDHLVNMVFDFGKAEYFDQQRLDFYLRDYARKNDKCYGIDWLKPRRYGMTAEEMTQSIYTSMENFKSFVGLVSNEIKKTKSSLFNPIVDAVIARPMFMRPAFYTPSNKKPRAKLEYISGTVDLTIEFAEVMYNFLGGGIEPYPTTPNAMDGLKKFYIVMDEVWKWLTASPLETIGINKKCLEAGGIVGKMSVLSTMGDSDDYIESVKEGIRVWHMSNPNILNENGMTESGLLRAFISAIHSKSLPKEFTDKFGKVNEDQAMTHIRNSRPSDTNSKEYTFECRRMPINLAEALSTADNQAIFPRLRINERLLILREMPLALRPYRRGFLDQDKSTGKVTFREAPDGIWKVFRLPYFSQEKMIDTSNRFKKSGKDYYVVVNPEGVIGYDPVRYADVDPKDKSVSKASIIVRQKLDYFGSGNANQFMAHLLYRPDDPEEAHHECIKACLFWGFPVMHERQVESVERVFKEEHMENFMLKNPKDGKYGMWTDNQKKVVKNGVDMFQSFWQLPKTKEDVDRIADCPSEEVLMDADTFNPSRTTKSDTMMSVIMSEYGMLQIEPTNQTDNTGLNDATSWMFPKRGVAA